MPVNKIINLRNKLIDMFVQRDREVDAVVLGLMTGEPVLLVAPPGTAKTQLIETTAKFINAKLFHYLLTRFTEPDELLGTIDIVALKRGEYRRVTKNRLPEAEIVFLDEIFKGSSAIRNILLDIILNKRYLNGGEYHKLPMIAFYGASNEVSTDVEDWAFYDRLTIRVFSKYVGADAWAELILKGLDITVKPMNIKPIINADEVRKIQEIVKENALNISNEHAVLNKYLEALSLLRQKGIEISDRRKVKLIVVASAISLLYNENTITLDSIAEALRYVAIESEDDIKKVEEVILKTGLSQYLKIVQKIQTLEAELRRAFEEAKQSKSVDSMRNLTVIYKKTITELKTLPRTPRLTPYVRNLLTLLNDIKAWLDEFKRELFGDDSLSI